MSIARARKNASDVKAGRNHQTAPPKQSVLPSTSATTSEVRRASIAGKNLECWYTMNHSLRRTKLGCSVIIRRLRARALRAHRLGHRHFRSRTRAARIRSLTSW